MRRWPLLLVLVLPLVIVACGGGTTAATSRTPSLTTAGSGGSSSADASGPVNTLGLGNSAPVAQQTTGTQAALTADAIVAMMKWAGLPIGDPATYDENTDPDQLLGQPREYTQKTNFPDTQLDAPNLDDGAVEVFASSTDAAARKAYIDSMSKSTPSLGSYAYQSGDYLLRITFEVPPTRAKAYQAAFLKVLQGG